LVLLDIMMPGMSGYDVLEVMKKDETLAHVSVIVLSARASREAVIKGLELGAADYLSKPFHRKELLCRLRVHLELKKQQDRLREEVIVKTNALEVAEEASKVKTQFLANMSHEIRTPLNGILGYLQLALDSAASPEREYLKNVEERTNFLMSIVNDILDMARIESQEAIVEEVPCVPSEVVNGLVPGWNAEAGRAGLHLEWKPSPTLDEEVHTDPKLLGRILGHLVGNAIKFTPSGHVRITGKCEPTGDAEKVTLEFQVHDTGIGIPPLHFESIFLAFIQIDSSNTRKYGGAGLGLAISRSLARRLGGDLTVESSPGKGSTFSLVTAARRAEAVGASSAPSLARSARRP
ncbi:MAG TPA: ATP-binding protein, partial [Planctomycetota bacterium]|nr:ATP-binding protein [Planctomycetota bacterium]